MGNPISIAAVKASMSIQSRITKMRDKYNDLNWRFYTLFKYYDYVDYSYAEELCVRLEKNWYHYEFVEGKESIVDCLDTSRKLIEKLPYLIWEPTGNVVKHISYNKDGWMRVEKISSGNDVNEKDFLLLILNNILNGEIIFYKGDFEQMDKAIRNWMNGFVKEYLNKNGFFSSRNKKVQAQYFPLDIDRFIDLVTYVEYTDLVDHSSAKGVVFDYLVAHPEKSVYEALIACDLLDKKSDDEVGLFIREVLAKYPDKVIEYKKGKVGLASMFMGEVMKKFKGKFDAKTANEMVVKELNTFVV